jgi:hypothetical protein
MPKPILVASEIINLTDARYFAARGADYLLFDADHIALADMLEIKEWVEGPAILVNISSRLAHQVDEIVLKLSPAAIGHSASDSISHLAHIQGHLPIFQIKSDGSFTLEDIDYSPFLTLEDISTRQGIIISGSPEKEVGMKSFDDIDALLDVWEELD